MLTKEDPLIAQRRSRFNRALIGVTATLVLAVVFGGWLWPLFAVIASGSIGYIAILRHLKLQRDEARRVVRELHLDADERVEAPRVAVGGGSVDATGSVRLRRWED